MKFWIVSPNASNNIAEAPFWKKVILEKGYAFMGWDEDNSFGRRFIEEIEIGDFILVAQGANRNKEMYIGGIVTSEALFEHIDGTPNQAYYRKLNPVLTSKELEKLNINFEGAAYGDANRIPALYVLHPNKNNIDKEISEKLFTEIQDHLKNIAMNEKIELLRYKKQIILQGPPGTGKTHLAKLIAKEMTKSTVKLTPVKYLETYIKNFKQNSLTQNEIDQNSELINEFTEAFPKSELHELSLDSYCVGKGSHNSFCYWLEVGLASIGRFSPGQGGAPVYCVYYSQEANDYRTYKVEGTPTQAMNTIAEAIHDLVNLKDTAKAKKHFRKGLIIKILNSYFPDEYFPVYSQQHLKLIAVKLFELDIKNCDEIEINTKINNKFNELKLKYSSKITNYQLMRHLYDKFDIKNGLKDLEGIDTVEELGEYKLIQFHPAYTYEDFVRGITAKSNNNNIEYKVENKILALFADKALKDSEANYILIIDEINRANLPSVLGELIYALEYRYDETKPKETTVDSMYSLKSDVNDSYENNKLTLPNNLFIIGTMNTADRSVGHIDYAIRRRFAFVPILADKSVITEVIKDETLCEKAKTLFDKVTVLFNPNNLAPDFKIEDVQIGHSYFLADTIEKLKLKLEYEIKPILREYLKDGILIGSIEKIGEKDVNTIEVEIDKLTQCLN